MTAIQASVILCTGLSNVAQSPSAVSGNVAQSPSAVSGNVAQSWLAGTMASAGPSPDYIISVRGIYTGDPKNASAEALAIRGGVIVAVGSRADVERLADASTFIESRPDAFILPGLIDAHGHMSGLGSYGLGQLDFSEARSFDDVVKAVAEKARAARKGDWIVGGRWDHESWAERKLPTHESLSAVTPDNPVWLRRVDGHAGIANAVAMKLCGVSRDSQSPPGGEIIKSESDEPTGVLIDNAMNVVSVRAGTGASARDLLLKAQEMCLAAGLIGVHDAGLTPREIEALKALDAEGSLKIRFYGMIAGAHAREWFAKNPPGAGRRFTLRATKLYMDGAMGSRGAWLLSPYNDRPSDDDGKPYVGLALTPTERIREAARDGLAQGYQVCTHAIGNRANREVLDAYQAALDELPAGDWKRKNHRFRVEHAQLLAESDIPRFAALGVIASMQPTHCTSDMRWVAARVGEARAKGAYAWASLLRSGAVIASGSDFPVESHNPMLGIYAAITRQDAKGEPAGGWHPAERLTRAQAIASFTLGAAYAEFAESQRGTLEVGKQADFVIVDRDLLTCPPMDIPTTKVLRTVIAGETVFQSGSGK